MKITLYKGCCLNNSYKEVFAKGPKNLEDANSSPFLLYLNSLTKKVIEIDYAYMENSGTLIFDFEFLVGLNINSIYDFNYMKVEFSYNNDNTNIERYCFIKSIKIVNELVYLAYEEDVWHSYSDKIQGFNTSLLSSSRLIKEYDSEFELPYGVMKLDYDSFNGIVIEELSPMSILSSKYNVIVEIQAYTLSSAGQRNDRDFYYLTLTKSDAELMEYSELNIIDDIIAKASNGAYKLFIWNDDDTFTERYYEIGNIYVFPDYFNLLYNDEVFGSIGPNEYSHIVKCYYPQELTLKTVATKTVNLNYLKKEIGTLQTRISIDYNKLEQTSTASILYTGDKYGITVMLKFQGQIVDITNDFKLDYPIQYIGAAEFKQQKIAAGLAKLNAGIDIFANLMGFNASFANNLNANVKAVTNGSGSLFSGENGGESMASEAAIYAYLAKVIAQGNANDMNYVYEITKGGANIFKDIGTILKLNAKAYGVSKGILNTNNTNLVNILNGIMTFSKSPKNYYVPRSVINNYGYSVEYIINDRNWTYLHIQDADYFQSLSTPINYNVLQFADASVYGSFTTSIAKALNTILNNGVKIYYIETKANDNLVVG